jgi:hypothetical protein
VRQPLAQEVRGVPGLSDDVEPGLGQQPGDSLTQQNVVLADHHS